MSRPAGIENNSRIRTAFFGRTANEISVAGLKVVLSFDEIELVSVTCGRDPETSTGDGALHRCAREAGIELLDFQEVRERHPTLDLAISFSNPVIFPPSFLDSTRLGVLNMHPAPLPEFRGCHMIEHALIEGATEFGVTLHYCAPEIDSGPLVEVARFPIRPEDCGRTLWHHVDELAVDLLERTLPRLIAAARVGRQLKATPQDPKCARYFADNSLPVELELDLAQPREQILRCLRAYDHPRRELPYVRAGDYMLRLAADRERIVVSSVEHGPA